MKSTLDIKKVLIVETSSSGNEESASKENEL